MRLQLKIFGGYRYQTIEDEFNAWAQEINPFVVKTILNSVPVPRTEEGFSLYFTLAIFFSQERFETEIFKEGSR